MGPKGCAGLHKTEVEQTTEQCSELQFTYGTNRTSS